MCHVALEMASETLAFLHVLLVLFIHELLEWWLGLGGGSIDIHWDDTAVILSGWSGTWGLPSVEQARVTRLILAAEVKPHTGEFSYFLCLPSCCLLPVLHCCQLGVPVNNAVVNIILQPISELVNCPLGVSFPSS